jgi:menaquinone-dependent protoporphyrinogen IX oxidase
MEKILVVYTSGYGATANAAKIVAETLAGKGLTVDLYAVNLQKSNPSSYDVMFIGSPIHLGRCTKEIKCFLKKHLSTLTKHTRIAFFFTCMSVTDGSSQQIFPVYIDPSFSDPVKPPARIRFMENNHTVSYYLKQFYKFIPGITPLSIAFFKGRLDTAKLSLAHRLIMRFAMFTLPEIQNGNYLNQAIIRHWTENVFEDF